jgi:hypothetical protein
MDGNKKESNDSSGDDGEATSGSDEEHLPGRCPECNSCGQEGDCCTTCEDQSLMCEHVKPGHQILRTRVNNGGGSDDEEVTSDSDGEINGEHLPNGSCPDCNSHGRVGDCCTNGTCEDSGVMCKRF